MQEQDSNISQQGPGNEQRTDTGTTVNQIKIARKHDGWRSILSTLSILIAAPLVAVALTTFVFQSYEVDGPSMESTLQNKDRLIVLKVQKTWAKVSGHTFIPNRGDVIVFNKKGLAEFCTLQDKQLIKRVIGLPGERIVVNNGTITVFNKENPNGFDPDKGREWEPSIEKTNGNVDLVVQPGEVFVCGDNRNNSLDSRSFGSISAQDIVGKLVLRILPLNQTKVF